MDTAPASHIISGTGTSPEDRPGAWVRPRRRNGRGILNDANIEARPDRASPGLRSIGRNANLERLGLNWDTLITVHPPTPDRPITRADLLSSIGRGD
jgi:hypothetical protein